MGKILLSSQLVQLGARLAKTSPIVAMTFDGALRSEYPAPGNSFELGTSQHDAPNTKRERHLKPRGRFLSFIKSWVGASILLGLLFSGPASAFEFFDGRVQVHGFYEMQFRVINADFSEQWDVSQWYNVFNVEFELDLIQDTIGPLDLMQAYIRLEARYDCVYSRGCGMFRSLNSWGDRAKNLPRRLSSGTKHVSAGVIDFPDDPEDGARLSESLGRRVVPIENVAGLNQLAEVAKGGDGFLGVAEQNPDCTGNVYRPKICKFFAAGEFAPPELILDDSFTFTVQEFEDYRFTNIDMKNDQVAVLGPWLPKNIIYPNAVMANKSNPLDSGNKAFDKVTGEILEPLLFAVSYNGRLVHLLDNRESKHGLSPLDRFLDQIEGSIDPFEEGTLPAATGWISRELNQRNIVSYSCPFDGPGGSLPNGTASVSDCGVAAGTVWKDVLVDQGYNEAVILAGLASWDGFEGGGGNWVQLFIDHRAGNDYELSPIFNPNPAGYISYDRPKAGGNLWSPFNTGGINGGSSMGEFEPGALQFAEDSAYGGALPLRPVAVNTPTSQLGEVPNEATGAYYPSTGLRKVLDSGRLNPIPFNISEKNRAFNRGYSQRQTKELKEAYLDIELFDSRLWLRVGKQTIVWGKTELFSFSDQFNPQDLALASLPSLEESRIPLWSLRAVYSLYSIGPLDDVRLEFAFNFDQNQPADLGACGEAYTVDAVCQLTFGLFAHGITGLGVVGVDRPPSPWHGLKGWELGGRIEFRWDRFSFAIAEYYGYDDFPTIERVSNFERNIDPTTGLPRFYGTRDPCVGVQYLPRDNGQPDDPSFQPGTPPPPIPDPINYPGGVKVDGTGCLTPGPTERGDYFNTLTERVATNALNHHFANQQVFTTACYATSGIAANFDPGACGLNVWNSLTDRNQLWHFAELLGHMFAGTYAGQQLYTPQPQRKPAFVRMSVDSQWESGGDDQYWDASNRAWAPDAFPERNFESNCFDDSWALAENSENYRNPQGTTTQIKSARAKNPYSVLSNGGRWGTNNGSAPFYTIYRPNCGEDSQNYMTFFDSRNIAPAGSTESYGLSGRLAPEQEALVGCGPFMGTNCDVRGIDFMTADISILVQSWPGIDGTEKLPDGIDIWRTDDGRLIQPGTVDFRTWESEDQPLRLVDPQKYFGYQTTQTLGAPRCTTNYLDDNRGAQPGSEAYVLPGCRGLLGPPADPQDVLDQFAGQALVSLKARFRDETGYWHSPATMFFYPYREDGNYPQAECNLDPNDLVNPACGNLGIGFQDDPKFHNQWEAGYDVRRDGNPLGVSSFFDLIDIQQPLYFSEFYCRDAANRGDIPGGDEQFYSRCITDVDIDGTDAQKIETWGFSGNRRVSGGTSPPCVWPQDRLNVNCFAPDSSGRVNYAEAGEAPDYADEDKGWFYDGIDKIGVGYIEPNPSNPTGDTGELVQGGLPQNGRVGQHPFTGQVWQNELAALSWNLMVLAVGGDEDFNKGDAYKAGVCSWVTPQYCDSIRGLIGLAGLQHRNVEAGGNGTYGRRSMVWHAGGEILIDYTKRNVLGFAVDFAEDYTKTNWSFDFTWIDKVNLFDATSRNNVTESDQYALTISIDRPTFINFLNPNHTFFINSQWFISYYPGWHYGMVNNGPWNVLGTVTALTGYFQDRLNAQATVVYDFKSNSGGVLPQVNYRVNQDFTITVGAAVWFGREQLTDDYINPIAPFVNSSYKQSTNQLISNIRNRDELFLRLRYTF